MSDRQPPNFLSPKTQAAIEAIADGYASRNELLPGARDALVQRVQMQRHRDRASAIRWMVDHLETGLGRQLLNPERVSAEVEAPLRAVVRRMPVDPEAADAIYDEIAAHMAPQPLGRLTAEVWGLLNERPEFQRHLKTAVIPSEHEVWAEQSKSEAMEAIRFMKSHFHPSVKLQDVAREWASSLASDRTFEQKCRSIERRLKLPIYKHFASDDRPAPVEVMLLAARKQQEFEQRQVQAASPPTHQQPRQGPRPLTAVEENLRIVKRSGVGI